MSPTPKHKIFSINLPAQIQHKSFLPRPIFIRTDTPLESCTDAIWRELNYLPRNQFDIRRQKVEIDGVDAAAYRFRIEAQQRLEFSYLYMMYAPMAYATGVIRHDDSTGQTMIEGTAYLRFSHVLAWSGFSFFVAFAIWIVTEISRHPVGIGFIFIMGIVLAASFLGQMCTHRNRIVNELERTIRYMYPVDISKEKTTQPESFERQ